MFAARKIDPRPEDIRLVQISSDKQKMAHDWKVMEESAAIALMVCILFGLPYSACSAGEKESYTLVGGIYKLICTV